MAQVQRNLKGAALDADAQGLSAPAHRRHVLRPGDLYPQAECRERTTKELSAPGEASSSGFFRDRPRMVG